MRKFFAVVAFVLVMGLMAWGDTEHYETLPPGTLNDYRRSATSPLDGGDSLDWDTPLSVSPSATHKSLIATKGNPTLYVGTSLSLEGATVQVYCGLYRKKAGAGYEFLSVAGVSTATGGASTTGGSYAHNRPLLFDTGPATHVELRVTDPSDSATVTLKPFLGGHDPAGVE